MGCEVVVSAGRPDETRAVEELFAGRDRRFSRFRVDSELSAVNACAGATLVSAGFASALAVALEAAAATGGLVDPTLGAAVVAAGYDRDFSELEDSAASASPSVAHGCWKSVSLTGRLLQRPSHVQLDLNGVVKALAVDDSLRLLRGRGFVSAGGDMATSAPVDVALPGGGVVRLVRGGIATSGRVGRRWLHDGAEQHHLIDPRTGMPSRSPWTQVTVVGATCLAADVCAKAAFLLGDDGPDWLDAHELPGRFLAGERVVANDAWTAALGGELICT